MSNKNERAAKLIALDNMIRHQKRAKDGSAKFNKDQLEAANQALEEVLALDGFYRAEG